MASRLRACDCYELSVRADFSENPKMFGLYANAASVIGMFEQMSRGISAEDVSAAGQWGRRDRNVWRWRQLRNEEIARSSVLYRIEATARGLSTFGEIVCARTIVDNFRTASGQDAREYARSSSYIVPSPNASTVQDADTFVEEIGHSLTFTILSLIRHDARSFESRFDSIHYETLGGESSADAARERREKRMLRYDENLDSYSVLLQQSYAQVYRVKIFIGQIERFIAYMVDLWNEQIEIVNFE